ncbi:MAG: PEGA domain-containing protein, partial [Candidatus Micrarchaeota archaeon]
MVLIQRKKDQFTITLPKDVVALMGWNKGVELYPYPDDKGNLILKQVKQNEKAEEKTVLIRNKPPHPRAQFTFGFPFLALFALSFFGVLFQGAPSAFGMPILFADDGQPEPTFTAIPEILPTPIIVPSDIPTPMPTPSISPTPYATPFATNAPSPNPTPSISPSPSDIPSVTPNISPNPTPTISPSPSQTPSPNISPNPSPTFSPTPEVSVQPTSEPTLSPNPTTEPTSSPIPTSSPTSEPTISPTPTITISATPTSEPTSSPIPNTSPSPSTEPSPTYSPSPTACPTPNPCPSPTYSPSPTFSPTPSESPSPMPTPTISPSPNISPNPTPSETPSPNPSPDASVSPTPSASPEPSVSPSPEPSAVPSPTFQPLLEPYESLIRINADPQYAENIAFLISATLFSSSGAVNGEKISVLLTDAPHSEAITGIDGAALFSFNLTQGNYTVTAIYEGNESIPLNGTNTTIEIIVLQNETNQTIENQTNQTTGTLFVETTPAEANVFLDGEFNSLTPANIANISLGFHTLLINKTNYSSYFDPSFYVDGNTTLSINLTFIGDMIFNESNYTEELNISEYNFTNGTRKKPTKFKALFTNKKKSYKIGEEIRFEIDFNDYEGQKIESGRFSVFLVAPDGAETEVSLRETGTSKEFYIPASNALQPGQYYLRLHANFKKNVVERYFVDENGERIPDDEPAPDSDASVDEMALDLQVDSNQSQNSAVGNSTEQNVSASATPPPKAAKKQNAKKIEKIAERIEDISDGGLEDGFALGLVNLNTHKSIYLPNEIANITVGVLNPDGSRADTASVVVQITSPSGIPSVFTTDSGAIRDNYDGEYTLLFPVTEIGKYSIYASAQKPDAGIDADYSDSFEARSGRAFDIERQEPTLIWLGMTPVSITITSSEAAQNVRAIEYVPSSFEIGPSTITTSDLGNGYKQIIFDLGNMAAGEKKSFVYSYNPPPKSPMLYLSGPLKLEYGENSSYSESRSWTIGADDRFYIHDLTVYFNRSYSASTPYPWEPMLLCVNHTYNITVVAVNGIAATDLTGNISIQSSVGGPYSNIPSNGWVIEDAINSRNVRFLSTATAPSYGQNATAFIVKPQSTGSFSLRSYMSLRNAVVQFQSNVLPVYVRSCANVQIGNRDISIKGPDGTSDILMAGSTNYIAIPLINFNESANLTANATLSVLLGGSALPWYAEEGDSQQVRINQSNYTKIAAPVFNESVVLWRLHVPDDADTGQVYTASIEVKSDFQTATYTKSFTLATESVQIFTSSDDYPDASNEDAQEHLNMSIAVCNYGDKPITDGTISLEFPATYFTFIQALPNNSSSTDSAGPKWDNVKLGTSSCWGTVMRFNPIDITGLPHDFITQVAWDGGTRGVEETRTLQQPSSQADTPYPFVRISSGDSTFFPNASVEQGSTNTITTRIYWMGGSSAGDRDTNFHIVRMELAQGFSKPSSLSVPAMPGFPIGSVAEGWVTKLESLGQIQEATTSDITFSTTVSATPSFQPGGKRFFFFARGSSQSETATSTPIRFKLDDNRYALVVQGPFMKSIRYYATDPSGPYTYGLPSEFTCGTYNVSNMLLNKGNRDGWRYNITDYFPSVISPVYYNPATYSNFSSNATWGAAVNFTMNGTDDWKAYNYSFTTPLGLAYNQLFQAKAVNGTSMASHDGRRYYVNFTCTDTPQYQNASVNPQTLAFGFLRNFTIAVYSEYHDLYVNLSMSPDGLTNWTVINTTFVNSAGSWATANFTQRFGCGDIGTWYYNFTVFDTDGNINMTVASLQTIFTVEKDTLQLSLVSGNGSLANRSSSNVDLLSVRVNDTNGTYLDGFELNFSVTTNLVSYGPATLNSSNSSGIVNYYFNATCDPTEYDSTEGQSWKASLAGSSCYNDITSDIYTLQVKGYLANNVTNPKGDENYTEPANVLAQGNVKDDCENFISPLQAPAISVSFNFTTNESAYACPGSSLSGGFYECTLATSGIRGGFYNVTMNATAEKYYSAFQIKTGPLTPGFLYYFFGKARLDGAIVVPASEGWGVPVNYSVNVTTPVYYVVSTSHLFIGTNPSTITTEVQPGQDCTGTACVNVTKNWTKQFVCDNIGGSQIGTWFYKFTANTSEEIDSETSSGSTTVEKDDVNVTYHAGNLSIANRTNDQTAKLSVNITDIDRWLAAGTPEATVTFNITTDGTANATAGSNTTQTSGIADYYFNPTCSHSVGRQAWCGFTTVNTCYKDYVSDEFFVDVYGDFTFNISNSNSTGSDFTQGENVTLTLTNGDDCNNTVANATIGFTIFSIYNITYCAGDDVVNHYNGTYTCTFNTSTLGPGYFNVTANASKAYFNFNSSTQANNFRLLAVNNTIPLLLNISAYPDPAGWGEQLNFSVLVRDSEGQDVNTSLYNGNASTGPWAELNMTTCQFCSNNFVNFTIDKAFTCSDIGTKYFFFNGTDEQLANGTSEVGNWTIEQDNVTISYSGGNSTNVTRQNTSIVLTLQANDTDNLTAAMNAAAKIWVTTDGSTYDAGNSTTTNSTGHFNVIFKPSCSYAVGQQKWIGGTSGDTCYFNKNSSTNYVFNITGALNTNATDPIGLNVVPGENVTLSGTVIDDCGNAVTGALVRFSIHDGGGPVLCADIVDEGDGIYNCTLNSTDLDAGYYRVMMNASKEYYANGTSMRQNAFFIQRVPVLSNPVANLTAVYWGGTIIFNVTVSGKDNDVTVNLWQKKPTGSEYYLVDSQLCQNCSNVTMQFSDISHDTCADYGTWSWKFNATNLEGLSTQTTPATFDLTRRILVDQHQEGNGTSVNRVSGSTFLATKFVDGNDSTQDLGTGTTVTLFTTKDGSIYVIDGTNTSINAIASRNFDPTCTIFVGPQKWKFGVPQTDCYYAANSSEYNVTVTTNPLINNLTSPLNGTCYIPGTKVIMNGTISDECSGVAGASPAFYAQRSSSNFLCGQNSDSGSGNYGCTWDSTGRSYGLYNVTLNSTKQYYADGLNFTLHPIRLAAYPELKEPVINVSADGWGTSRTFNITVNSLAGGVLNVSLWVRAYGTSAWTYRGSQQCSNCFSDTNVTFADIDFTCSNLLSNATWEYKFNASLNLCNSFTNESAVANFTLQKNDVNVTPYTYGSSINRQGTSTIKFASLVYDTERSTPVGGNVNGAIWVSYNGTLMDNSSLNATNSSGYIVYDFDPTCSYDANQHFWKAGVLSDSCYKDKNSSTLFFDIVGQSVVALELPEQDAQYNVTQNATIRFNITSECSQEGFLNSSYANITVIHEQTSAPYSCSPIENETNGYYNCTWPTTGMAQGNYSLRINSSMPYYDLNSTLFEYRFYLKNLLTLAENLTMDKPEGGWGRSYQFNVSINDPEQEPITCMLFTNTSGEWVERGNGTLPTGTGNCSVTVGHFACGDIMNGSQFMFQIINTEPTNTFNTSIGELFNITQDTITLSLSGGDGVPVNRSGGNSTRLTILVYDEDYPQYAPNANGTIWITTDGVNLDAGNATQTNSTGDLEISFDPSCSYGVGDQEWY